MTTKKSSRYKADLTTYTKESFETKEIEVYTKIEHRHYKKGTFYMETFEFNKMIIENEYNSTTIRTLLCLKARLQYNNRIATFRQANLAEEAHTSQANISRTLRQLEKDNIIYKDGLDYYFNEKFIKYAGDDNSKTENQATKTIETTPKRRKTANIRSEKNERMETTGKHSNTTPTLL